jgi:hypothetical protein
MREGIAVGAQARALIQYRTVGAQAEGVQLPEDCCGGTWQVARRIEILHAH